MTHEWKWIEKSPMQDGSGIIISNGVECKVVIQYLISTKHRVALIDGVEVARASKFTSMMKSLDKITSAI